MWETAEETGPEPLKTLHPGRQPSARAGAVHISLGFAKSKTFSSLFLS